MKSFKWTVLFLIITVILLLLAVPVYGDEGNDARERDGVLVRRLAVIIGANDGGPGRPVLRYAETDAKEISQVFLKMGGIKPEDHTLLLEPTKETFLSTFGRLHSKINDLKQNYRRVEVVFYYSGHSDEEGLLLGGGKIPYKTLRQAIDDLDADFRIVILDSCASGAFTLLKGGKKQPPFLMDSSINMSGYAFLTSSSSEEPSQESDQIKGSFFTHYLISALRGAADAAADGKITLNEAYQYAFRETLSRTENTLNGPQHPSYDIQMTGAGDVVMTDIRETESGLTLGEDIYGRIYIHNDADLLIVELNKSQGKQIEIGLESGNYRVTVDNGRSYYQTEVLLKKGEKAFLASDKFSLVKRESTTKRGDEDEPEAAQAQTPDKQPGYILMPLNISVVPIIPIGYKVINNVSLSLIGSYASKLDGFAASAGLNIIGEEANGFLAAGIGNIAQGRKNAFSAAGVFNITNDSATFFQAGGVFNLNGKNFDGFQSAGVLNCTVQNMNGFQAAGVFNYTGQDFNGFGAAGVFNYNGQSGNGFQAAGVFNYTDGVFNGFQSAGVFNYAKEMDGFQCGAVNVADQARGLQIGVVNVANKMDGLPIGVLNLIKDGQHHLNLWKDETGFYNLGLKLGSKSFYNIYTLGAKTPVSLQDNQLIIGTKPELVSFGAGLGFYKKVWPFFTDFELLANSVQSYENYDITNNPPNLFRFRASLGLPLLFGSAIIAGCSYNLYIDNFTRNYASRYPGFLSPDKIVNEDYYNKYYAWPGFFVEIQL